MDIAGLRVRVTIQKNETIVDRYKNHACAWTDYFTCWATCVSGGKGSGETQNAAHTQDEDSLDITVRYGSEVAAVNSKEYRILVAGRIYNITGIDEMGFRHNSRKFHTVWEER